MALLILALLQRIFLMSSLMLLLVWLIFFMVLIKLLPILGTISGKTVKLMVLYAQNEMLAYQQKESTARVASIMENTNLSKQQQVSEIMRQMLTQAQTAGQYFTN